MAKYVVKAAETADMFGKRLAEPIDKYLTIDSYTGQPTFDKFGLAKQFDTVYEAKKFCEQNAYYMQSEIKLRGIKSLCIMEIHLRAVEELIKPDSPFWNKPKR